ncbi:MAG: hypothetical protein Q7J35_11605 [Candidatus Methanoperedens sp.]|nr:hypothetical protein [Candidatus Methanoperedens sp.]
MVLLRDPAILGRGIIEIILALTAIWISQRTHSESIERGSIMIGVIIAILGIIDIYTSIIW